MTPITAPPLPTPTPASDLPIAPANNQALSAFDPSLSSAAPAAHSDPAALGNSLMHSLNGYQADLQKMNGLAASFAAPATATPAMTAPTLTPPTLNAPAQPGAAPGTAGGGSGQPMVGLMMQTFNFAIETELVTRAATQFTGSVSTLMKGQ